MMPIALVVADMAGTTVSDSGVVERAFEDALRELGTDPFDHLDTVRATMGQSKIAVFRTIFEGNEERAVVANCAFEAAFAQRVSAGAVAPLPGVESALAALRARGVRVCLTTGFSSVTRDLIIEVLGWETAIDGALSPTDDARGRPEPDLIFDAMRRFGVGHVEAVAVVGDTVADLQAGSAAGAGVVAGVLTGAHSYARLLRAPHTHLLRAFPEVVAVAEARAGADRHGMGVLS